MAQPVSDQLAIDLAVSIHQLGEQYAERFERTPIGQNPALRIFAAISAYTYLQCEAINVLVGYQKQQGLPLARYDLQVAQLLRSIIEAWATVVWLYADGDADEQTRRAVGYGLDDTKQTRAKLDYQREQITQKPSPETLDAVAAAEKQYQELESRHGVTPFPSKKRTLIGNAGKERYLIWRWECNPTHVTMSGIQGMFRNDLSEEVTYVSAPDDTESLARRLITVFDVSADLFSIALVASGSADDEWFGWVSQRQKALSVAYDSLEQRTATEKGDGSSL